MVFTKEDKKLLHLLVQKELTEVQMDVKKLMLVNAEYITKTNDDNDLDFLKTENKYEEVLRKLLQKLK